MAGQQLNPQILWLSCHQQRDLRLLTQAGRGGHILLIPFLTPVSHQFSHSWHFLADHQPWLPASSQTFYTDIYSVFFSHAGVQTGPHSKIMWNADFLFRNYCLWSNGKPFSSEEHSFSTDVVWYTEQQPNSSLFFLILSCSSTDREWRAQPGK